MRYGFVILIVAALVVTTLWRFAPEPSRLHSERAAQRTHREAEEIEIVEGSASIARPGRVEDGADLETTVGAPIRAPGSFR